MMSCYEQPLKLFFLSFLSRNKIDGWKLIFFKNVPEFQGTFVHFQESISLCMVYNWFLKLYTPSCHPSDGLIWFDYADFL